MSWSQRRALVVVLIVASLTTVAFWQTGSAKEIVREVPIQVGPGVNVPGTQPGMPLLPGDLIGFNLPVDNQMKARVEAAQDYIGVEDWVQATQILQSLIEHPSDVMAQLPKRNPEGKPVKDAAGKFVLVWTNVKKEAYHLLGTLPEDGMEYYKVRYNPQADELLARAKETGAVATLAEVMGRFLYTDAGGEAARLLSSHYLDRGDYSMASLCFKRLVMRDGLREIPSTLLFKAAYTYHQNGDEAEQAQVWAELTRRGGNIRLGDKNVPLAKVREYIAGLTRRDSELTKISWPIYGGSPNRTAKGVGDTAFMEPRWQAHGFGDGERAKGNVKDWLDQAFNFLEERGHPIIPAFFPVTATIMKKGEKLPLVAFRDHWGIKVLDVRTGKLQWHSRSEKSFQIMAQDSKTTSHINSWITTFYKTQRPSILFENSVVGSLSTDNTNLYSVEDTQVPPPPSLFNARVNRGGTAVAEEYQRNQLQGVNLKTGKLLWIIPSKNAGPLADSYFLGPPLPIGGKLYVLNEKLQELRLVTLDPNTGKTLNIQNLGTSASRIEQDLGRRMHAAHLAYGEGMLLCPTNSGAMLCIDLLTNSLVWAYGYRDTPNAGQPIPNQKPGVRRVPRPVPYKPVSYNEWKVSAPIMQNGKVVFTAPDSDAIHCVNLRDGSKVWKHPRGEEDLYLAGVFNGKALVVGKRSCYARSLTTGEVLWTVDTGEPSGYGIASDNLYYLPLRKGAKGTEPEICAIDLARGKVHAHTKSRKKIVPGNLVFYEGAVLSQTVTDVTAFPQLRVKLRQIDQLITANPNDPVGLTERGELRLDKGDLQGAVSDLRKALQQPKIPETVEQKAKTKLYESLTEYLQRDFNAAETYLGEYKTLCKLDTPVGLPPAVREERAKETRRRMKDFLCLVAKGKEKQGKLIEAFDKYQEFTVLAGTEELTSVVDEPTVRAAPDVWVQGRIAAMVAQAKPADRKPLEDRIAKQWEHVQKSDDLEELRRFVNLFGSLFTVGREARLRLSERLLATGEDNALLDAERQLQLLRLQEADPKLKAQALEVLARLYTRKGLLEDAAYCYTLLGTQLSDVEVVDGKTGADLYNELATDKRFLGYLDQTRQMGAVSKVPVTEEPGSFPYRQQEYFFGLNGEKLPYFYRHKIGLNLQNHKLSLTDLRTGDVKWSEGITRTMFQQMVYRNATTDKPKVKFQTLGHIVVLPVAHMVYGIDAVKGKILWERNLFAKVGDSTPTKINQLFFDPIDGSIQVIYNDGWLQRFGGSGGLTGGVVYLQNREGLVAVDPVTGKTLWIRSDISSRSRLFNDGKHIFVVEMTGENTNQQPVATRALRAYDGVSIKIEDFTKHFANRKQVLDGEILATKSVEGGMSAYLYDVLTGKETWSETFAAGSKVLDSENENLFGIVEPDGKLHFVDLQQRKKLFVSSMQPEHFKNATTLHMIGDDEQLFVLPNNPLDAAAGINGNPRSILMPSSGMRSLPVNGEVYAFDLKTGKFLWRKPIENHHVILAHFEEMPFLVFGVMAYKRFQQGGFNPTTRQEYSISTVHKRNGKYIYDNNNDVNAKRAKGTQVLPSGLSFYAINIEPLKGTVEMISQQFKLTFYLNGLVAKK